MLRRFLNLFGRRRLEQDMSEEMRFHLEMQAKEHAAAGLDPTAAHHAARRDFGGVDQIQEQCRDQRGWMWLEEVIRDFAYAFRQLRRTPSFSALAIALFALGISLATIQGGLVYAALFRELPFEGSERLFAIRTSFVTTLKHYVFVHEQGQQSFEQLTAFTGRTVEVSGDELTARTYRGVACTADTFTLSDGVPLYGRTIQAADTVADAPAVLLLGHEVWKNDFAGDPSVIGRTIRISGQPATVVGVMPPGYRFPINEQVWTNLRVPTFERVDWWEGCQIVGRLRPGVPLAEARAELALLSARFQDLKGRPARLGAKLGVVPFLEEHCGGPFTQILWLLLGLVGVVMVLVCLNTAHLLHARLQRQHAEWAVRLAIGASRGRLLRQILIFCLCLAGLGAIAGALLATGALQLINQHLVDPQKPFWIEPTLDVTLCAWVTALAVFSGLAAGLLPALHTLRHGTGAVLKRNSPTASRGPNRLARALTVGQIALASAVMFIGVVLIRGIASVQKNAYPGDLAPLVTGEIRLQNNSHGNTPNTLAQRQDFTRRLREACAALPDFEPIALTNRSQVAQANFGPVEFLDSNESGADARAELPIEAVDHNYFPTLRLSPRAGRCFTERDLAGGEPVVLINATAAAQYWAGRNPIGARIRVGDPMAERAPVVRTIVGIVPDLPTRGIEKGAHTPCVYVPFDANGIIILLARTGAPTSAALQSLRQALHRVAPDQPFRTLNSLAQSIADRLRIVQVFGSLSLLFGVVAAIVGMGGLFGINAFQVECQTREFGIRLALGAEPRQIVGRVLRRGAIAVTGGLSLGLVLGWAFIQLLRTMSMLRTIAQATPFDYFIVAIPLAATVLLACWLPARRASRVNPSEALRAE